MTQSEKIAKYEEIVPQIEALVSGVEYGISSLANIAAMIHRNMNFFWTGFYVVFTVLNLPMPFHCSIDKFLSAVGLEKPYYLFLRSKCKQYFCLCKKIILTVFQNIVSKTPHTSAKPTMCGVDFS
ncbi:MAG: hypothetical protein J5595_05145 [Bacteroidales bacterium]|nr:hypothetical protein [Bacteroidales bacterium]